jgi:Kef-type K+ transport system membrane component KefB
VYYAVLVALAAAVATFVFIRGAAEPAHPAIAGGYDVESGGSCLGARFDLVQSGRFLTLRNSQGTLDGDLTRRGRRVTGMVECVRGWHARLEATAAGEALTGTIAGAPLRAVRRRDPAPAAGSGRAPRTVEGEYAISPRSECLGNHLTLSGSDRAVRASAEERPLGALRYAAGTLTGTVDCPRGGSARLTGTATGAGIELELLPLGTAEGAGRVPAERVTATARHELAETIKAFFVAVVVVMLFARAVGSLMPRISQPRVMGEVLAGIMLGPTVLGALAPQVQDALFPAHVIPFIGVVANLGLIFYMFLVGLELDLGQLRGRVAQTIAISNTGVLVPMTAGLLVALPTYALVGPSKPFAAFALFMGVAMSITAFPVLARIIVERRMLRRPVGALALAAAAVDDITAWFLIALATAVAVAGSGIEVVETVGLAVAFCLVMAFVVRRLLSRASTSFEEVGRVPGGWVTAIFAGVLLSAYVTEAIGIALIFGAFVMGVVMPRHAGLTEDITHRVESFVLTLLLPLFFAFTGLRTNVGLLDRPELVVLTLVLIAVAILCKFGGTVLAARVMRMRWRESAVLGTLMNTRGLTELIVLNLALEKGVISQALFTALVLMALVTTFMAGPLLRIFDPRNELGAPPEEELRRAKREQEPETPMAVPERSILVAPQTDDALARLRALTGPLARSQPPRELILARLVAPPAGASARGGLQTELRALDRATATVTAARRELIEEGVAARAVAFTSTQPGQDLVRLAEREGVDLLVVDGRRPLLGGGVPRGDVGTVLAKAPCDVAVLVAPESARIAPGPDAGIVVPFGGDQHDWAALELGAWMATATGARLRLLGAAGGDGDGGGRDASRLLANASLLVQRFVGVAAEPVIAEPGREGVLAAAEGAGLLVIGLSDRWRREGLGATRRDIARTAPAPILFVRRGMRPGALAPRENVTRFTWSSSRVAAPTARPVAPPPDAS